MSNKEMQNEEIEVLLSIYDGDENFKKISDDTIQYKFGDDDNAKSFLLELKWGENYPKEKPIVNMNTFYNRNLLDSVKSKVMELINNESVQFLGEAMTYSLIEVIKEKYDELVTEQPEEIAQINENIEKISVSKDEELVVKKQPKKEQLTKAQKRKQWDKVESKGEKPRGWDWVDIVRHLSQTGVKESETVVNNS